jgi:hypothetical protein
MLKLFLSVKNFLRYGCLNKHALVLSGITHATELVALTLCIDTKHNFIIFFITSFICLYNTRFRNLHISFRNLFIAQDIFLMSLTYLKIRTTLAHIDPATSMVIRMWNGLTQAYQDAIDFCEGWKADHLPWFTTRRRKAALYVIEKRNNQWCWRIKWGELRQIDRTCIKSGHCRGAFDQQFTHIIQGNARSVRSVTLAAIKTNHFAIAPQNIWGWAL